MPFDEYVTPGWSLAYPSSRRAVEQAVKRQPTHSRAGRVYPSWSLAYPQQPATPADAPTDVENGDTGTRLLRQAFSSHMEIKTSNVS
jgi:hypothetical protein